MNLPPTAATTSHSGPAVQRRTILTCTAAVTGATVIAGCSHAGAALAQSTTRKITANSHPNPFRASRQPGIQGQVQPFAAFVALDLVPRARDRDIRRILRVWSDDIDRLMNGRSPLTDPEPEMARHTAGLTVTVGVGRRVVDLVRGRAEIPSWLGPLPAYPIDKLQPEWSGGDLLLQICADSPTTVAHALRRLTVGVADLATIRWVQRGFREPLATGENLVGMRNLFGQVDGTINPVDDAPIFIADQGPEWLRDGSTVVIRRIRMDLDAWERVDRGSRENALGRRLTDGAPVTGGVETDTPDFDATNQLGFHIVDDAAHVRRARATNPIERFLRRPYSYDDGTAGHTEAGLIFVSYQADPLTQYHPVQQRLAEKDLMNIWTTPIGSSVFVNRHEFDAAVF